MDNINIIWLIGILLLAFAGGAFGSTIGALPAFIFCGLMVVVGESITIYHQQVIEVLNLKAATSNTLTITSVIGFGPIFGPHISFAGGAAASAYAAKKGYMETNFVYHEAKNIMHALGPRPDTMMVGGLFGMIGYLITKISTIFHLPWDPVAAGVIISAVIHRVVFNYPIIGNTDEGILNMQPFEEKKQSVRKKGRYIVEPWLSHQYKWIPVTTLGGIVGCLAVYITAKTGSIFLPFGISAALLVFLNCGVSRIPVTHHISLIASTGMVAMTKGEYGQYPLIVLLFMGSMFGIFSALSGEFLQRIFYAHSDTHLDPPAAAIVMGTLLISFLAMMNIFPSNAWIPQF